MQQHIFEFSGGDGDQTYFGAPFLAVRVKEDWFPDLLPRGNAWLLKIKDGIHKGDLIAITPRVNADLEEQISHNEHSGHIKHNWISVVVHLIKNPDQDYRFDLDNADAFGMAVIRLLP